MRPKKIYINKHYLEENDGRCINSARIHPAKPSNSLINYAEYTDLSQVWHDSSETPDSNHDGVDAAWVLSQERDGVHFTQLVYHEDENWSEFVEDYDIQRWAYLSDFVMKGGER